MASENFSKSLTRVLTHEGGYSNHPSDRGGPTMKGVIQRVYDGYRNGKGKPRQSVKLITQAEIRDIYRKQYWDAVKGDDLPAGVDYCVFDAAVNSGPSQAGKWLQRAVKAGQVDGQIGFATLAEVEESPPALVINSACDQRMFFLRKLDNWPTFGPGWIPRVKEVRAGALAMAAEEKLPATTKINAEKMAKAPASETKTTETEAGGEASNQTKAIGIGIVATIFGYLERFNETITAVTGLPAAVTPWIIGTVVVGALGTGLWFAISTLVDVIQRKRRGEQVEAP